jgi:thymidylate synthase (FAD)
MGSDLSVVNAARVSFGKKHTEFLEGDSNLIRYLAEHKHMSPFGHAFASFHVKAPIFVARQLVKHKFLRWNEISRRYVDSDPEFYEPDIWRGRSVDKKQGSDGTVAAGSPSILTYHADKVALSNYKLLLHHNVCPEQARMVLPQSTMTEWYWSGSLDAFADMCNLRCKNDTQYETRVVANKISEKLLDLFPVSWEALKENDR